jgi:hypothetical protein
MTDEERVAQAVATLREHFDTVQIQVTRDDGGRNTMYCSQGSGNWFARYGYMRAFIKDAEKDIVLKKETLNEWENI